MTQNLLQRYWVDRLDKRVPVLVMFLALLLLTQSLATITWKFVPVPDLASSDDSRRAVVRQAPRAVEQPLAGKIGEWHLFGKFVKEKPQPKPVQQVVEAAPETRLNLKLRGVFASSNPANARAIIANSKGEEDSYKLGDKVPGGASLHKIFTDKVILDRNGRLETLKLPVEVTPTTETASSPRGGTQASSPRRNTISQSTFTPAADADTGTLLKQYKEALMTDPQSVMGLLRAEPFRKNGKLQGYRIRPGKDRQLLRKFGLRSGDVVTAVNGVPMDNPLKALELMRDLGNATSLTVDIERRGVPQSFTFQIP